LTLLAGESLITQYPAANSELTTIVPRQTLEKRVRLAPEA